MRHVKKQSTQTCALHTGYAESFHRLVLKGFAVGGRAYTFLFREHLAANHFAPAVVPFPQQVATEHMTFSGTPVDGTKPGVV